MSSSGLFIIFLFFKNKCNELRVSISNDNNSLFLKNKYNLKESNELSQLLWFLWSLTIITHYMLLTDLRSHDIICVNFLWCFRSFALL